MIEFGAAATENIQAVYDDPSRQRLADRIDEVLRLLDTSPGDKRLRQIRVTDPPMWGVRIHAGDDEFLIYWDVLSAVTRVRYAGPPPKGLR